MKKANLILAAALVALFAPLLLVHSCANTTQSPTGGPKDTIPPYIVYINPLPGTVNVPLKDARFYFEFNEYVKIKDPKNIVLSPPLSKPVKSKLKGKGLELSFEEALDSNTTYTISFTDAITDNNEGNPFAGFSYVFSTGKSIDSMLVTGTVRDCNTLKPFKNATVMLYSDLSDSAVFLKRPVAAAKSDDWGYFSLPFVKDTTYRIYAIKDSDGNNIYDPENDLIAFIDSLIRPKLVSYDTIPEMLKYDMKDTLNCEARISEHELLLFREKPTKQYLRNSGRTGERSAFISFQAPYAWIDSLWVPGYRADQIITQFNATQDSLLLWLNNISSHGPDTLHLFVNYRKTDDSTGVLTPDLEHLRLVEEGGRKQYSRVDYSVKRTHADSICKFTLEAKPETFEQTGFVLSFELPPVNIDFAEMKYRYLNPRQKESSGTFTYERDSTDLRTYYIRPNDKILPGYEYFLKIPQNTLRDITGWQNDSTECRVSLPNDESSSTVHLALQNVGGKVIVDLMEGKSSKASRTFVVDKDCTIDIKYLKEGKYSIRITDDSNCNSIVDTGSLLEHRQPEKVVFVKFGSQDYLDIPPSADIVQTIDVKTVLGK